MKSDVSHVVKAFIIIHRMYVIDLLGSRACHGK